MVRLPRILVVGGGIAGLCAVLALHRQGFAPELVEARPEPPVDGAAITLHPNGVRVLRELGVGDALDRAAAIVPRWSFVDAAGATLCAADLGEVWSGIGPCLGVTRARLMALLHDALGPSPRRLGCVVTEVRHEAGGVHVGFDDGSCADYDLVVGADGIHSTVRRLAVTAEEPRSLGTTGWRSVVDGRPPGVDHLLLLLGEGCFFGLVPVGHGRTYGFAGTAEPRDGVPSAGLAHLRRRFAHFGPPVADYLALLDEDRALHVAAIEDLDLDVWYRGRVLLVGDAAHAMPPHMGQGGSLAAEDALVLAEELARASSLPDALTRYTARRRPRVRWVREQTHATAAAWMLPPDRRDVVLREHGERLLIERYRPLAVPA
jgi:2-polyprenyl-6-methoxyphenol hydroxylase-like FAD-dependent oxidoreductase